MATQIYLGMPPENIVKWIKENYKPDMTKVPLTFTAEEAGAKLSFISNDNPSVTLETSTTGEEGSWQPYEVGTEIILENVGDKVMFRNSSDKIQVMSNDSNYGSNRFNINNGKIAASGNIMFLMDKTGELRDLSGKDYCYHYIFYNCTSLTQAPELPATTLAESCYNSMFDGCTSLTKAPTLPATTLAYGCYLHMYNGCVNIPEPKYDMSHMTFDEVADEIQFSYLFGDYGYYLEVQCSDKILVADYDFENYEWTITEK